MKKSINFLAGLLFILFFVQSCSKNSSSTPTNPTDTNPCTAITARFAADVSPIISASCSTQSACHGTGSTNGPGALTTYAQIKASAASIKIAVTAGTMPKTGSLTQTQINKISCWVNNGANND